MDPLFRYTLLACITFSFLEVSARREDFTISTDSFFTVQTGAYNAWLKQCEMSNILRVHKVLTDTLHDKVTLQLETAFTTPDSGRAALNSLRDSMAATNGLDLYRVLYLKFTHLFDVRPNQALLEIGDNYTADSRFLDMTGMFDGRLTTIRQRSLDATFSLPVKAQKALAETEPITIRYKRVKGKSIAEYINYVKQQFSTYCNGKSGCWHEENITDDNAIDLSVADIQNEVFINQKKSGLYERLDYSIMGVIADTAVVITIQSLDGFYGSGFGGHPPQSKAIDEGYISMANVPTYKTQLDKYQKTRFPARLREWITAIK